jgi:hypothetical protein
MRFIELAKCLGQAGSTFCVMRATAVKFGLYTGNMKFNKENAERINICIIIQVCIILLYLENFEMWCWRRMEKIGWTEHVRNEEVLLRVKKQRYILHEISKRKDNWIGHILRRNCLLQGVLKER